MNGGALRIRAYRPGPDDAALLALWSDALGDVWPATPAGLAERFRTGGHLIAEDGRVPVAFAGSQVRGDAASLPLLLVRRANQRRGLGTRMLAALEAEWKRQGARSAALGAGAGPYLWPGVPDNLPGAVAFFARHGWPLTERTADMEASLTGYTTPAWILEREAAAGIRIAQAAPAEAAEVLAFEREHFPEWHDYFQPRFGRSETGVLVARDTEGRLAGTVLLDPPDPGFVWEPLLPGAGAFGCIGVAEAFRERGIGMALCARSHERLAAAGVRRAFLGWVVLFEWYGKLGYRIWRTYRGGRKALL